MKKIKALLIILVCIFFTGCFGPGSQDWKISLGNDYYLLRLNSKEIVLGLKEKGAENSYYTVIDSYIISYAYNDEYIFLKHYSLADENGILNLEKEIVEEDANYIIIKKDGNYETNYETYSEESFYTKLEELGIKDINMINTVPAPKEADYGR